MIKVLVRLLAHEVIHAMQDGQLPDICLEEAEKLAQTAEKSGASSDYACYVSCLAELPAHATMIAADVLSAPIETPDFDVAARETWSFKYISKRMAGAERAETILQRLVDEARGRHAWMQK